MDTRVLKTFLRAVETQSFSRTAEELGYSQSTVTFQIKQLEEELGVTLFDRIGRQVILTEKGSLFASRATDIMNLISDSVSDVRDDHKVTGDLTVGASESLCHCILPPVIGEFAQKYPLVNLHIITSSDRNFLNMLKSGELDLVYFFYAPPVPGEWISASSKEDRLIFAASPGNPLAKKGKASINDILKQPLFFPEKQATGHFDLELALASRGITAAINPALDSTNSHLIAETLINGNGVTLLQDYVLDPYIQRGNLVEIKNNELDCTIWRQLIYHKNKYVTPQMRAFIDTVIAHE